MKQDKQKRNWIIDAVLFGGFLVALWLDLTGAGGAPVVGDRGRRLGRVSPGGALELGGGSDEPALRAAPTDNPASSTRSTPVSQSGS